MLPPPKNNYGESNRLKAFKNIITRKQLQLKLYSSETLVLVRDVALEFMSLFSLNTATQTHCVYTPEAEISETDV